MKFGQFKNKNRPRRRYMWFSTRQLTNFMTIKINFFSNFLIRTYNAYKSYYYYLYFSLLPSSRHDRAECHILVRYFNYTRKVSEGTTTNIPLKYDLASTYDFDNCLYVSPLWKLHRVWDSWYLIIMQLYVT